MINIGEEGYFTKALYVMYSSASSSSGLKPLMDHKAVGNSPFHSPAKSEASSVTSPAEVGTTYT